MRYRVVGSLLVLEFSDLSDLRKQLNQKLIDVDGISLRPDNYDGFNYRAKIMIRLGNPVIQAILRKNPGVDYVIGYVRGDQETKDHEFCHYWYFKDPKYRKWANQVFGGSEYEGVLADLKRRGYRRQVLIDEAQANFVSEGTVKYPHKVILD